MGNWKDLLAEEWNLPYMKELKAFLEAEAAAGREVYPPKDEVFAALTQTPFDQVQVVVMGQDPYHGPGQAHGLSFSVPKGVQPPPSLQNIFKEIESDLGVPRPKHGCLLDWAKQGVLLLNATLTVRAHEAKSHHGRGWERFTDRIVQLLCAREDPIAFLLWGRSALEKFKHVQAPARHLVLTAAHPSPLSAYAGFLGCRHFSKVNEFLTKMGKNPIDWSIRGC